MRHPSTINTPTDVLQLIKSWYGDIHFLDIRTPTWQSIYLSNSAFTNNIGIGRGGNRTTAEKDETRVGSLLNETKWHLVSFSLVLNETKCHLVLKDLFCHFYCLFPIFFAKSTFLVFEFKWIFFFNLNRYSLHS